MTTRPVAVITKNGMSMTLPSDPTGVSSIQDLFDRLEQIPPEDVPFVVEGLSYLIIMTAEGIFKLDLNRMAYVEVDVHVFVDERNGVWAIDDGESHLIHGIGYGVAHALETVVETAVLAKNGTVMVQFRLADGPARAIFNISLSKLCKTPMVTMVKNISSYFATISHMAG